FYGGISTPCPVAVSYIEHCLPELIPQMMPIQSPMVCAAIYCREELGITDRLAFIGPCIGKKMETDSYIENSPVHYNLTFLKLMQYVRKHNVCGPDAKDEIEYGLGSFYPAPGGLAENIRWFLGDDVLIRVVSGKTYLYGWLNKNSKNLKEKNTPFLMIDALNCLEGCIEGTGNDVERFEEDRMLGTIQKIKGRSKSHAEGSPWNPDLSPAKRHELLNEQFKNLQLSHYQRSFVDRSGESVMHIPSAEEADGIFNEMLKFTEESRVINCSACGYNSCHDMMVAIYNKFNTKYNCIHFEMDNAQRSVKEAEMANQAKSRFLSRMSHEIRTPINVIIGINNIALRNESISPRIRSDLNKVGVSAKHLLSLVNDILDVTRIESGVNTLKEEKFTFGDIMEQVCVIIGGQCDEKGLTFDHDMAIKPDEVFIGDSLKLKQIIINILGNSIKFTDPPGTVSLTIYEDEGTEKSTAKLRFIIRDTGIGMDAKYIPKIFDVFSQEDTANTTRYSGSGLGMAISKGFAEMMGGEISVESEKGVGSTFTVTVPLRRVLDEVASGGKALDKAAPYKTTTDKAVSVNLASDGAVTNKAASDATTTDRTAVVKTASDAAASDKTESDKTKSDKTESGGTASYRTASEKAASGTIPTEAPSDTAALEGRCVLIAEDQEMNAEVLI
ncbi:MAG: hypothetical protein J6Y90_05995, partial [Lachnospiraceae bacterium]|nr:hypothetical protein [Lachnospiraceae bacterium]